MIHPLANVETKNIGQHTNVWQFSIILGGAVIGNNCNINCHVFIENDVVIGNNVTVKPGVYLWDGIRVEDDVFIGPNVTFTNDKIPRSKKYPANFQSIKIGKGASLGAASVILGDLEIGSYAMVAAGALVTKTVPSRALMMGSPARVIAWLNIDGSRMTRHEDIYLDNNGNEWIEDNNVLKQK